MSRTSLVIVMVASIVVAGAALVAIGRVQKQKGLQDFQLGADFTYTADSLRQRVNAAPDKAAAAVVPVLFPLDLVFLLAFGSFAARCPLLFATAVPISSGCLAALLILPALYTIADLGENLLSARMLLNSDAITATLVRATRGFTILKWAAGEMAFGQAFCLLILSQCLPRMGSH